MEVWKLTLLTLLVSGVIIGGAWLVCRPIIQRHNARMERSQQELESLVESIEVGTHLIEIIERQFARAQAGEVSRQDAVNYVESILDLEVARIRDTETREKLAKICHEELDRYVRRTES